MQQAALPNLNWLHVLEMDPFSCIVNAFLPLLHINNQI